MEQFGGKWYQHFEIIKQLFLPMTSSKQFDQTNLKTFQFRDSPTEAKTGAKFTEELEGNYYIKLHHCKMKKRTNVFNPRGSCVKEAR